MGWSAAPILSREHPKVAGTKSQSQRIRSDEIKAMLPGQKAVIGYTDEQVGEHALAWVGETAIDCTNGEIVSLGDITINVALILTRTDASPA
jgi:hypothetical protein